MSKENHAIPNYSTLCRYEKSLLLALNQTLEKGENMHFAIDSTGLKVYGEGE